VALPGAVTVEVGTSCTNNQVVNAIAVDVSRTAYKNARIVTSRDAVDCKAIGAVEGGKVETRTKPAPAAKYYVTLPGAITIGVGISCPNNQISNSVTVDISCTADGVT
jgi:hypothetical protein